MTKSRDYYLALLTTVQQRLTAAQPTLPELLDESILHQLAQVIELLTQQSDAGYLEAQDWLVRFFTHLPQLTPVIDRELLWYFGGDCLHFLSDEEIAAFQQAEDAQ